MNFWGIVVAAGSGRRFGGPKHITVLAGRPLWQWARDALLEAGASGVVVVGPVEGGVPGGERRQDSVAAGLHDVKAGATHIAVHDAARPLASSDLVERLLSALTADPSLAGVVPVVEVQDTIKRVASGRVQETLERHSLVAVQTPQLFRAAWLRRAHEEVKHDATDDSAMVEAIGGVVGTVAGEPAAMKVTYPEDLVLARHLIEQST